MRASVTASNASPQPVFRSNRSVSKILVASSFSRLQEPRFSGGECRMANSCRCRGV